MTRKGFTLIELLIVVAIIAVLAAIAVPNFLEAQVRSKVARVKADLRTLGIAINSYKVDDGHFPPGYTDPNIYGGSNNTRSWCYKYMTTPVSYMSAYPQDPFCPPNPKKPEQTYYYYNNDSNNAAFKKFLGTLEPIISTLSPGYNNTQANSNYYSNIIGNGWQWHSYSTGPSKTELGNNTEDEIVQSYPNSTTYNMSKALSGLYDPSNGTTSVGRIIYSSKGFVTTLPM